MNNLGDRMKEYEKVSDFRLQRKIPVIGRLDRKAFHTLTRNLERPFDDNFHRCMVAATTELCKKVQGCRIGYTQSDEITILLADWATFTTDAWFGYRVQKMCSVAASLASVAFNAAWDSYFGGPSMNDAVFDARFWNLTKDEVNNCFLWRQRDAEKNSISMLAQAHYSHKQLHKKNSSDKQDMLMELNPPINWNDIETWQKRGTAVHKIDYTIGEASRSKWVENLETPIFSKDPDYINSLLSYGR
jgi:tRNA(His) guanylyltransferase